MLLIKLEKENENPFERQKFTKKNKPLNDVHTQTDTFVFRRYEHFKG